MIETVQPPERVQEGTLKKIRKKPPERTNSYRPGTEVDRQRGIGRSIDYYA